MRIAILSLLFASIVCAADPVVPKQSIVGAEKPVALGELVMLSVSPPEKTPGLVSTSYTWKVLDGYEARRFAVDSNGNVFFGAGIRPKKLLALVAATHLFTEGKTSVTRTVLITAEISIGDKPPEPEPGPGPGPDLPPGRYGLSSFAYKTAVSSVDAKSVGGARKLAGAFKSIASAVRAGGIKEPRAVLAETKKANDNALGEDIAAWERFSDLLQDKLFALHENGELKTVEDYAVAWLEISLGLEAVK